MKIKALLLVAAALVSLNINAAAYTSVFTDNGNKVTEVRSFSSGTTETWEWLDLTVTNGISYLSLVDDLTDNGLLDVSNTSTLNASAGAIADVNALAAEDRLGWQTQSDQDIVNLFNAFFGLNLADEDVHNYNANVGIVETFISYFGDSYHEGRYDQGYSVSLNGLGYNSAYSLGFTNTNYLQQVNRMESAYVYDGQYHSQSYDSNLDRVHTAHSAFNYQAQYNFGTWLAREVTVDTPEPTSIALFALTLMCLGARRFKR